MSLLVLVACDNDRETKEVPVDDERELLDPEEARGDVAERCQQVSGGQEVTLRAKKKSAALEVGNAAPLSGGFAIGVLESGKESRAAVAFVDGKGVLSQTDLGRVHGSVEPPRVFAMRGGVVAVLVDNDAGHTRLRVAQLGQIGKADTVKWGPEVRVRRGETNGFSFAAWERIKPKKASALLVWDDYDKPSLTSKIKLLVLDPNTLQAQGGERVITPPDDDAVLPHVAAWSGGYWLVWLSYGQLKKSEPGAPGLIDEPPRSLRAQMLDGAGKPQGEPLSITPESRNVVAYDARVSESGALVVAYRAAESGRQEGAAPIKTRTVGVDGSVISSVVQHEELGAGAPAILGQPNAHTGESPRGAGPLWISARGYESDVLLGALDAQAESKDFLVEGGLQGKIPLARSKADLLVMRPQGLDLKLSTVSCQVGEGKSVPKAAPADK